MDRLAKRFLIVASIGHFSVAMLHYVMPFLGSWSYGYFGAPELTEMAKTGSMVPAVSTFGLAIVFTVFGTLGLCAAGIVRSWGFVRSILWILGVIYVLRGLFAFMQVYYIVQGYPFPVRHAMYSLVALVIGVLQLWGLWRSRSSSSLTPSHAA